MVSMIKKLLITLMVVMLPLMVVAQEIELSHNSSSHGSHFSDATYKAKFGTLGVGANYRSEPLGEYYKLSAINDFDLSGTRCFYFGSGVADYVNNRKYTDLGAGLYIINGEVLNLSVAGLLRKTQYLTSIRSRLSLQRGDFKLRNVIRYFPEVKSIEDDFQLDYKFGENLSVGYKAGIINDKATDKLYLKFKF